ncbi:MAG TPA: translocation/assembly module TamB domain-containing protein, partial [Vicinamibacteria bacterium]|nr:translocation/assembly module TamB domain-containing protein [Vicinamibacteria bacterium]
LSVSRLVIQGGEFVLDHDRVPLDLDLPDFNGRLVQDRDRGLVGHVSFRPGELRFGSAPPLFLGTEIELRFHRGQLSVDAGRVIAQGTDFAYHGRLRFSGRPQGQFGLDGAVDLAVLERHVMRSGLGFQGAARFEGVLSVDGSRLRFEGRTVGTDGVFREVAVPRFAGRVAYDGNGLRVRDLEVESLGGRARIDIDVPAGRPGTPGVRIAGALEDADAEGLLRLVFGMGAPGLGAAATGDVDVSWPKGRARLLSGRVGLDLAVRPDGRTPLSGRVDWSALDGVQSLDRVDVRTPDARARLQGRVLPDDRTDLAVDADSRDIAAVDDLLTRLRRALGNAEAQPAGFSGAGTFVGRWRGTIGAPVFAGRFSGRDVAYLGVDWGRADWVGTVDPVTVESRSLVLRRPGAELWLDGRNETGWFGGRDALDMKVRLTNWPAADLVKAMEWDLQVEGPVSGEATALGRRSAPHGFARITSRGGRYYRIPFEEAVFTTRWGPRVAVLTSGRARVGGGTVALRGSLTDDGVYDGTAEVTGVDVGALAPATAPEVALHGKLSGSLTLQGTLARPRLDGRLASTRIFVGDEGLGTLEARLTGNGDGRVRLDGRCRSPRLDLALTGTLGAEAPHEAALRLTARDTSLDPYLRAVFPALPGALGLVASGEVALRGPLLSPRALSVQAVVSDLQVLVPEYPLRNRGPLRASFANGRLDLPALHLAGEGTDLALDGGVDALGDGDVALNARGAADLGVLSLLSPRLRGRGAARLALAVTGTRSAPRLDGTLDIEGAGLRLRGFPHGIEDVRGRVRFDEKTAELQGITGTVGGGTVDFEGEASYGAGGLTSFDIRSAGRGVALRYPEGLRSQVDADLRLFGDGETHWMTGTIDVRQALWTRRYDLASELLAASPALAPAASLEEGVRLDVVLRAPGTIRIDNNLATLQARAEMNLQGTTAAPVMIGRAEVDRGRVYFQGRTYVIRQGTIDFVNPQKLDPSFDIEAETRIRSYRVTLRVNGTLERVSPTLTSDPPLSPVQILSLLAGVEESTVTALTQAQAQSSQAQLAAAGAATLAAGRLSEEVGLERGAEKLLGLNRFSIDPSLLRGTGTAPTARVTLGKRITPDLNVLYSQDLRGSEQRILSLEYTLSDRLSLLLTREDPGGFGFDLRLRQSR